MGFAPGVPHFANLPFANQRLRPSIDRQKIEAANHSAFNVANALGPLLGGLAIAAGWGWTSTGYVGSALALNAQTGGDLNR